MAFGVEDGSHQLVGTDFKPLTEKKGNQELENWLATQLNPRIDFNIFDFEYSGMHFAIFRVDATHNMPVSFRGVPYIRIGSYKKPLSEHPERERKIWSHSGQPDWSVGICPDATLEDLDPEAISKARANFKSKFPDKADEVNAWDDITFLNKAKLTIKGKITRTAIILLGRSESEHFINPSEAKIRWLLKDANGNDKDYHIEGCPLLLAVDKIYAKIRNLKYRFLREGTLFPDETLQYEPYVIREALNNCIAHQDYTLGGRINVVELDDQLIFTNLGSFIPGSVERVVIEDAPEEHYRNKFLATAMFNLKMVDTAGGGIRKMFTYQRERLFPLPEYEFSDKRVKVTVIGKVLDPNYAEVLAKNKDISLEDIILLDKLQKKKNLTEAELQHLRQRKLIEGKKPNLFISAKVAQSTGQKAAYSKYKGFDNEYYMDLILKAIREHGFIDRADIDQLLWNKLPEWMEDNQKKIKINNLLSSLRKGNRIKNDGSDAKPKWVFV